MAVPPFPQTRESDLLQWSAEFSTKITADPAIYGLTAGQATAFAALQTAFATAYALANDSATNSKANVEAKNTAKAAMLHNENGAHQLVGVVQAFPGTDNDKRAYLNIKIRAAEPTPAPVPTTSPDLDIISVFGHTIKVRVHSSKTAKHPKPNYVKGASMFFFVGDTPPGEVSAWSFAGNTTKSAFDIVLPSSTAAGAKVWVTAFWFNNKMQSGPAAPPLTVHVPGGISMAA